MSDSAPLPAPQSGGTSVPRLVLIALVLAAAAGACYYYFASTQGEGSVPPVESVRLMREYLNAVAREQNLAGGYTDADGDLLADPPADKGDWVDPPELFFTAVATDDPDEAEKTWQPFITHLATATGKKASYRKGPEGTGALGPGAGAGGDPIWTPLLQRLTLRDGKLHVSAFNTGHVPAAVNQAGFHPLFAPATADGKISSYSMVIIVPADSPVKQPEDLRGKKVALVAMSSNSGGKAPLALLKEKGLIPGKDYEYTFTGDHHRSVAELAGKKHDAACVAGDLLEQDVAAGKVKKDQYRVIYTSPPFPPLAFGVPRTLAPDLRKKIEAAFETFSFTGNSVGEKYKAQARTKFARIDYKKDFAVVRDADAKLLSLLDVK